MTSVLSRRNGMAITATTFAFAVTMMGTTLPTPLYSIYAAKLALSPLTVTALFAVYAIGVVATLSLFGRLSDEIGRRPVLLVAVACALLSAVLFLLPPSLPVLVIARILSGLGAGLMSGTGTAAVIDLFAPERKATAGTVAIAVNAGGLATGTLLSGVLADLVADSLVVPYAVHLVLTLVAATALWTLTPRTVLNGKFRIRPHRLRVPVELRGAFTRGVLATGAGFAVAGVLTAVGALFLVRSLHLTSHTVAGFLVFLAFAGMAIGQLLGKGIAARTALPLGCAGTVVAAGFLAWALSATQLLPLLVAAVIVGMSSGLCLNAGIASTVEQAPSAHRGEISSSFFAGLYSMLAIPSIGVGVLVVLTDLRTAGLVFTGVVAVLALVIGITERATVRR
ncbi:MFS transporter [Kibdelosporangium phytohabitans]|uniref:MFS transporter n=1 Tax=Kibdelosporangium phytohabitans TaxID=860235 RepID=A0A0N9HUU0_9PSEU|nr:MFS transporter [Kibdelosporangium phytohabitans]ALG07283.1 MFS transporter [Kibdelosporangium phytohabitans]MBE1471855.1 MFS family permease [Kibdelosporangium phytohabitans]